MQTADTATKKWSFEIAPDPITEDKIAETIEADVVVVGCGTSGLMAANSAAEEGLGVVVVSASAAPLRAAARTTQSIARRWSGRTSTA